MLSTEDFILQYEPYSDQQLNDIHRNRDNYSPEAQEALDIVIRKRGGMEAFKDRLSREHHRLAETSRVKALAGAMARQNVEEEKMQGRITSDILSPQEIDELTAQAYNRVASEREDGQIKSRTIIMALLGIAVASLPGAVLFGLWEAWGMGLAEKVLYVLCVGIILLVYSIIKRFTRKTYRNIAVLISTIIAFILSFFLGQLVAGVLLAIMPA